MKSKGQTSLLTQHYPPEEKISVLTTSNDLRVPEEDGSITANHRSAARDDVKFQHGYLCMDSGVDPALRLVMTMGLNFEFDTTVQKPSLPH
jgi:hypothetical protein